MTKSSCCPKGTKGIFIVEDHPVFRDGLASLVEGETNWTVCGTADNAREALTAIERTQPDVVLVDIGLPGKSGLELIKDLKAVVPEAAVLAISMHEEMFYAERVLRAGGRGYIMKQAGPENILEGIRQVLGGKIQVSSRIYQRILDALSGGCPRESSPVAGLTDREFEVLQLLGQGKDGRTIAEHLGLSLKTVDTHRKHLREKLGLRNGTELLSYAAKWVEAEDSTSLAPYPD